MHSETLRSKDQSVGRLCRNLRRSRVADCTHTPGQKPYLVSRDTDAQYVHLHRLLYVREQAHIKLIAGVRKD
jgi:hypothetical protein